MEDKFQKPAVEGFFENCKYGFFPNIKNSEINEREEYFFFRGEHLPQLYLIKNKTSGMFFGDGGFTVVAGVKIAVTCHDCVPLIIMGRNFVGVVHISWRNLYLNILEKAFEIINLQNVPLNNLQIVIGPHISKESMEFKNEDLWKDHPYYNSKYFMEKNGTKHFNMESMIIDVLESKGISSNQIIRSFIDTYTNNSYASFRRNGINSSETNFFIAEIIDNNR